MHGSGRELRDFSNQKILPAPDWAKKGVLYQIFPRVFTKEGTFKGIHQKLDYIKQLGVDIIWLKPIYPIGLKGRKGTFGSSYSVKNFREINPDYGTEEDFKNLVKQIHNRDMKIIIGIVPNHAANDNNLRQNHPNWFITDPSKIKDPEVHTWTDVTVFNYDDLEMRKYMTDTLIYWIEKFDIDGYRCDVAGMVPFDFWNDSLKSLREVKSDIFLLAEWEDPELQLQGFNADYDWTLYYLLCDIRKGKNQTSDAVQLIYEKDSKYPQNSIPMRFLENHDHLRSLNIFGKDGIEAYADFIFTTPSIPLIYAGQEFGENQQPSLFEKNDLNWKKSDIELVKMYQDLIQLRKQYSCFIDGNFIPLDTKGEAGAFLREDKKSKALVISNLSMDIIENLSINLPEDHKARLEQSEFINYRDSNDKVSLQNLNFDQFKPLTTYVYISKE